MYNLIFIRDIRRDMNDPMEEAMFHIRKEKAIDQLLKAGITVGYYNKNEGRIKLARDI